MQFYPHLAFLVHGGVVKVVRGVLDECQPFLRVVLVISLNSKGLWPLVKRQVNLLLYLGLGKQVVSLTPFARQFLLNGLLELSLENFILSLLLELLVKLLLVKHFINY